MTAGTRWHWAGIGQWRSYCDRVQPGLSRRQLAEISGAPRRWQAWGLWFGLGFAIGAAVLASSWWGLAAAGFAALIALRARRGGAR